MPSYKWFVACTVRYHNSHGAFISVLHEDGEYTGGFEVPIETIILDHQPLSETLKGWLGVEILGRPNGFETEISFPSMGTRRNWRRAYTTRVSPDSLLERIPVTLVTEPVTT